MFYSFPLYMLAQWFSKWGPGPRPPGGPPGGARGASENWRVDEKKKKKFFFFFKGRQDL